mmetsp:Transcript_36850/g.62071  ORF Transcript_36850/g.62071 Transcript_36850/m.62071 type:complete len:288 (-) Transcript_36850:391-1254(-)
MWFSACSACRLSSCSAPIMNNVCVECIDRLRLPQLSLWLLISEVSFWMRLTLWAKLSLTVRLANLSCWVLLSLSLPPPPPLWVLFDKRGSFGFVSNPSLLSDLSEPKLPFDVSCLNSNVWFLKKPSFGRSTCRSDKSRLPVSRESKRETLCSERRGGTLGSSIALVLLRWFPTGAAPPPLLGLETDACWGCKDGICSGPATLPPLFGSFGPLFSDSFSPSAIRLSASKTQPQKETFLTLKCSFTSEVCWRVPQVSSRMPTRDLLRWQPLRGFNDDLRAECICAVAPA